MKNISAVLIIILSIGAFIFFFSRPREKVIQPEKPEVIEEITIIGLEDFEAEAKELFLRAKTLHDEGKHFQAKNVIKKLINGYPASNDSEAVVKLLAEIENAIQMRLKKKDEKRKKKKLERDKRIAIVSFTMQKDYDKERGLTWYRDETSPTITNTDGLFLYFHRKDDSDRATDLRLKIQHRGGKWLGMTEVHFDVDGKKYSYIPENVQKGNESGLIFWEWTDETVNRRIYQFVDAISKSKKTVMRIQGKKESEEREIFQIEKDALKNVLYAYETFGGGYNFKK